MAGEVAEIRLQNAEGVDITTFPNPEVNAPGMSKAQVDLAVDKILVVAIAGSANADNRVAINNIQAGKDDTGQVFTQEVGLLAGFNTISIYSTGVDGEKSYYVQIIRGDTSSLATAFTFKSVVKQTPSFSPDHFQYDVELAHGANGVQVATFTAYPKEFLIYVNNTQVANANFCDPVDLPTDGQAAEVVVVVEHNKQPTEYTFTCTHAPEPGKIQAVKIFPSFGVGRVGNSPNGYFIGPETPGHTHSMEDPANPEDEPFKYKDEQGRMKRQVPRFRVYAYDSDEASNGYADSRPFTELTLDHPDVESITWHVELANKKGSWYQFKGLFNINQHLVRNDKVKDRATLDIAPGPRSISGTNQNTDGGKDSEYRFDNGNFLGYPVYLGELQTDAKGRLLVFGGHGHSYKTPEGNPIFQYANNDYWYDDTSGGPVGVTVVLKNGDIFTSDEATLTDDQKSNSDNIISSSVPQSSVTFAPPKYAPDVYPMVTLYDVMTDVAIKNNFLPARPDDCVFYRDIYPILKSGVDMDYVSNYAALGHSHMNGMARDILSAENIAKMNSSQKHREGMFRRIRKPLSMADQKFAVQQAQPTFMPRLAGNNGDITPGDIHTWLSVTEHQYRKLEQWMAGDFATGQLPLYPPYLDEQEHKQNVADPYPKVIPIEDQPQALDRAALEPCIGGAFFPGIEMTYICMSQDTYMDAYRINPYIYGPGDIGKYMALPWQADFFECMDHWWPTQRPDDVVPEQQYNLQGDNSVDWDLTRVKWVRGLRDTIAQGHDSIHAGDMDLVDDWWKLGVVVPKVGKYGKVQVETERDYQILSPWVDKNHPSQQ